MSLLFFFLIFTANNSIINDKTIVDHLDENGIFLRQKNVICLIKIDFRSTGECCGKNT